MSEPLIQTHAVLDDELRRKITAPLDRFSRDRGFVWQPDPLILSLETTPAGVIGGLIGHTQWGWLRIDILAVHADFRGLGLGRRLVAEAERQAIERGCHGAWVDTFQHQSPGFYERLGYSLFGRLPDYPRGQERRFYSRPLSRG